MSTINFGFLLMDYQAIDVIGPLDVIRSSSKPYISGMAQLFDPRKKVQGLQERAPNYSFHHIGETMAAVKMPGNLIVQPTDTVDTCPPLDFLLIGGTLPRDLSPRFTKFVRDYAASGKTLFTTCTGGLLLASTGLLDGKEATTNHEMLPFARERFPKVKWTMEKQWVIDGNIWTSGGAVAGMDMLAHWVRENFGEEVSNAGLAALDFEPRDQNSELVLPPQHWRAVHAGL